MKNLLVLVIFLGFIDCHAQQRIDIPPRRSLVPAIPVLSPGTADNQYATVNANNWKLEVADNPSNAMAWLNYYIWTERAHPPGGTGRHKVLTKLVADARHVIPGTPEYALLRYFDSGKKDSAALFQALSLSEDQHWAYPYVIQFLIRTNNKDIGPYCRAFAKLSPLSPNLYEYHYNALMSADSNATIYAQGLNDLVPMAVLQQVHGVRQDIRLQHYDRARPVSPGAYLCLSLGKEIISRYPQAAYTGLLVKTGGTPGIHELKSHVETFTWDFLKTGAITGEVAALYSNYLPSFILLYRHYKQEDQVKATEIKTIIERIANSTGARSTIDTLLEK